MYTSFRLRVNILFILIVLASALLITRLYFVQIAHGEAYQNRAERQYLRDNDNLFDRGDIFFTTKDGDKVPAATIKRGFAIALIPQALTNTEEAYEKVNAIVPVDRKDFFTKAEKQDDPYEEIVKRAEPEIGEKIDEINNPGVRAFRERWRYYPAGTNAAQTLGFVGYKDDVLAGRYGLERQYEDVLHRGDSALYVNFFAEIFSNVRERVFQSELEGNIVTTIEPSVQSFVEQQLSGIHEKWNSDFTGAIVINPQTGAVYALALSPSYDPNLFNEVENPELFVNGLVEGVYEMGSVIKPITMAAGLDAGVVTPKTTYDDKGFLVLNTARISNYDGRGRGVVDMQEVLNQSLNTGVAFIANKMGNEKFSDYMKAFGLRDKTGVDLPNESENLTDNLDSPRDIEMATASYGQGIALTPISTARALAVLGNGGKLVTPYVVDRIEYETLGSKSVAPTREHLPQVISKKTSEEITRMLVRVVDEALLDGTYSMPRYSIAAKTGTAQVANGSGGGYASDRFLHSFFGYFPAYEPEFLVFFYTMNPTNGARFASETLTVPFMETAEFLIHYYEIEPDR